MLYCFALVIIAATAVLSALGVVPNGSFASRLAVPVGVVPIVHLAVLGFFLLLVPALINRLVARGTVEI